MDDALNVEVSRAGLSPKLRDRVSLGGADPLSRR
jgi:hypothetical protein